MKIIATSGSAITILNAIRTGYGMALGIHADIEISIAESDKLTYIHNRKDVNNDLLLAINQKVQQEYNIKIDNIEININSSLPPERGLKTSSAISSAYLLALSNYYKLTMSIKKITYLGGEISKNLGISLTGALDDAISSLCGGLVITNNLQNEVLLHENHELTEKILLFLPAKKQPKRSISQTKINNDLKQKILLQLNNMTGSRSDIRELIELNLDIYKDLIPHEFELLENIIDQDEMIGLNGGGPSLYLMHNRDNVDDLIEQVEKELIGWKVMQTSFRKMEKSYV